MERRGYAKTSVINYQSTQRKSQRGKKLCTLQRKCEITHDKRNNFTRGKSHKDVKQEERTFVVALLSAFSYSHNLSVSDIKSFVI